MEQKQIAMIMQIISNNYQNQLNKLDINDFYSNLSMFLKDQDYTSVANNLKNHVMNSVYLPTIADLVKKPRKEEQRPNVPNAHETRMMIENGNRLALGKPKPSNEERRAIFNQINDTLKEATINAKRRHFNPFE